MEDQITQQLAWLMEECRTVRIHADELVRLVDTNAAVLDQWWSKLPVEDKRAAFLHYVECQTPVMSSILADRLADWDKE